MFAKKLEKIFQVSVRGNVILHCAFFVYFEKKEHLVAPSRYPMKCAPNYGISSGTVMENGNNGKGVNSCISSTVRTPARKMMLLGSIPRSRSRLNSLGKYG